MSFEFVDMSVDRRRNGGICNMICLLITFMAVMEGLECFQSLSSCVPDSDRSGKKLWRPPVLPVSCRFSAEILADRNDRGQQMGHWCDDPGSQYPWEEIEEYLERSSDRFRKRLRSLIDSNVRLLRHKFGKSINIQSWRQPRSTENGEDGNITGFDSFVIDKKYPLNIDNKSIFKNVLISADLVKDADQDIMIFEEIESSGNEMESVEVRPDEISLSIIDEIDEMVMENSTEHIQTTTTEQLNNSDSRSMESSKTEDSNEWFASEDRDPEKTSSNSVFEFGSGISDYESVDEYVVPSHTEKLASGFVQSRVPTLSSAEINSEVQYYEPGNHFNTDKDKRVEEDHHSTSSGISVPAGVLSQKLVLKSPEIHEFNRKTTVFPMEASTSASSLLKSDNISLFDEKNPLVNKVQLVTNEVLYSANEPMVRLPYTESSNHSPTDDPLEDYLEGEPSVNVNNLTNFTSKLHLETSSKRTFTGPPTHLDTLHPDIYNRPACDSMIEVRSPFYALNTQNVWKTLINMPPFESFIHMEHCREEGAQGRCASNCRCKQRFTIRTIPVYERDSRGCDTIYMDKFLFPSHCDCMCLPFRYPGFQQQTSARPITTERSRRTSTTSMSNQKRTAVFEQTTLKTKQTEYFSTQGPLSPVVSAEFTAVKRSNNSFNAPHTSKSSSGTIRAGGLKNKNSIDFGTGTTPQKAEKQKNNETKTDSRTITATTVAPRVPIKAERFPLHTYRNRNQAPPFSPLPRYVQNELEPPRKSQRNGKTFLLATPR